MCKLNFLIILLLCLNACSHNFQNNGLSQKKLDKFEIEVGKTSKQYLIEKYGPPIFENVFNKNVIYYVSHNTSYKTFEPLKTDKLLVFEIVFDNKNIVKKYKKYTEKDSLNINISKTGEDTNFDFTVFWKDLIGAMTRNNIKD